MPELLFLTNNIISSCIFLFIFANIFFNVLISGVSFINSFNSNCSITLINADRKTIGRSFSLSISYIILDNLSIFVNTGVLTSIIVLLELLTTFNN